MFIFMIVLVFRCLQEFLPEFFMYVYYYTEGSVCLNVCKFGFCQVVCTAQ